MTTLADTGQIYVTYAAARSYIEHSGLREEEARRELTRLLCRATQRNRGPSETAAELWRYRSRTEAVDISARVVREPPLAIVVAISVRDYA